MRDDAFASILVRRELLVFVLRNSAIVLIVFELAEPLSSGLMGLDDFDRDLDREADPDLDGLRTCVPGTGFLANGATILFANSPFS